MTTARRMVASARTARLVMSQMPDASSGSTAKRHRRPQPAAARPVARSTSFSLSPLCKPGHIHPSCRPCGVEIAAPTAMLAHAGAHDQPKASCTHGGYRHTWSSSKSHCHGRKAPPRTRSRSTGRVQAQALGLGMACCQPLSHANHPVLVRRPPSTVRLDLLVPN